MDRRRFFTVSAASAAGLSLPASLEAEPPSPEELTNTVAVDLDEYAARIDAGVARIAKWSHGTAPGDAIIATGREPLVQAAVTSLFVTGMLGDLPVAQQVDKRIQDRVVSALPVFDEAVDGMGEYLASLREHDLRAAADFLREPGAKDQIITRLDEEAALTGVSAPRRRQLRDMLSHVTWRIANQPPELVVNEYLEKTHRAAETNLESEAWQRLVASRAGEQLFWKRAESPPQPGESKGGSRGAKTLGIGLAVFAISTVLVAVGAFGFVFGMTVGAVMMLIGLIMLIATAGRKA
jgi:hypothetical protein